jgi:hypothetical protein
MQKETSPALDRTACNCLALRQAARHVSQLYDSYLASEGLRTTQYSILAKLDRLGPLSINEFAKSMVMDRTTLGRAHPPAAARQVADDCSGRRRPHTQLATHNHRRGAAEGCEGKWLEAQKKFEMMFGAWDAAELRSVLQRVVSIN